MDLSIIKLTSAKANKEVYINPNQLLMFFPTYKILDSGGEEDCVQVVLSGDVNLTVRETPKQILALANGEPVAYLHVMHIPDGEPLRDVRLTPESPWGERGVDYSEDSYVVSHPLYIL